MTVSPVFMSLIEEISVSNELSCKGGKTTGKEFNSLKLMGDWRGKFWYILRKDRVSSRLFMLSGNHFYFQIKFIISVF